MIITKELLSNVLLTEITESFDYNCFGDDNMLYGSDFIPISRFELANRCKMWAYCHGIGIQSSIPVAEVYDLVSTEEMEVFVGKTEQEAIFIATQWIIDRLANENI